MEHLPLLDFGNILDESDEILEEVFDDIELLAEESAAEVV